jgi:hypothetical protein
MNVKLDSLLRLKQDLDQLDPNSTNKNIQRKLSRVQAQIDDINRDGLPSPAPLPQVIDRIVETVEAFTNNESVFIKDALSFSKKRAESLLCLLHDHFINEKRKIINCSEILQSNEDVTKSMTYLEERLVLENAVKDIKVKDSMSKLSRAVVHLAESTKSDIQFFFHQYSFISNNIEQNAEMRETSADLLLSSKHLASYFETCLRVIVGDNKYTDLSLYNHFKALKDFDVCNNSQFVDPRHKLIKEIKDIVDQQKIRLEQKMSMLDDILRHIEVLLKSIRPLNSQKLIDLIQKNQSVALHIKDIKLFFY